MSRILTTHVGSLPRPEALTRLMYAHQEGAPPSGDLQTAVTGAVRDVVAMQLRAGIDIVSDGEMSKPGFVNYVTERLTGFGGQAAPWSIADLAEAPELIAEQYGGDAGAHIMPANCEGAVSYMGRALLQRDIDNLRAALGDHEHAFMPAASPGVIAVCSPNLHYPDYDAYIDALADAMAEEYRTIVAAGLVVQLDCPDIPMAAHTEFWCKDEVERRGLRGFAERHVAAIDRALEGIDPRRVRLHMCWGNYEGPHHLDAPLRELIEPVLAGRPGMISFEAANPRHEHEWEEFETLALPEDKIILPGVVDTLTNFVEHPRLVAQRIERYARLVGPERVIASTDCGFGTFVGFGQVGGRVAEMKLQALAEGARLASTAVHA
jgi:5-methyltetrahydropteroyltriglutamate--homocysteine methyltransferase